MTQEEQEKTVISNDEEINNKIIAKAEELLQLLEGYSYELAGACLQTAINSLPARTYIARIEEGE